LHLVSLAGRDATMAIADARGIVRPTQLFETWLTYARKIKPRWVGLDTAADIFVVNERDRSQVRQCISLLRGACLELDCGIILLAHPSLSGISSGTGLSGSTAWNNSVRSRLYLKSERRQQRDQDADDDEPVDQRDVRILECMKSNYSALSAPKRLTWRDGLLMPEKKIAGVELESLKQRARDLFLELLKRKNSQDDPVSPKDRANNYAPKVFARMESAKALEKTFAARKRLFAEAMRYLFDMNYIYNGSGPMSAPKSKRNVCIYESTPLKL
jgi:RecA-family ATPase